LFDIENVCINIPTVELENTIKDILNNPYIREEEKKDLLTLINTVLKQNYLQFNNQFYKQNEALAM
jgi:hypothetical protein